METYDLTDPERPTIPKVGDEELDYPFDWTEHTVDVNDSIVTYTVDVHSALTLMSTTVSGPLVVAWVKGGYAGRTYWITCHITTAGGRKLTRTIYLDVRAA